MDDLAELSTVANSELVASTFPRSRISLSGLLNVIDGVASQEGRILIMTTNNSKALDSALLRPGRVDLRIRFELTSKQDVEDLFVQTYKDHNSVEDLELQRLGKEFASKIPAQKLSAAEIQGYLLKWKNESVQDAVANLGSWLEEMSIKR